MTGWTGSTIERARVTSPPFTERRRHVRHDIRLAVEVTGAGLSARCITEEIGAGGCSITLAQPVPVGTLLRVRLSAYGSSGEVAGVAQVVWASPGARGRIGLAFAAGLVELMEPFLRAAIAERQLALPAEPAKKP